MNEVGVGIVKTEETEKNEIKYLNINVSNSEVERKPDIVRLCADAGILEYVNPKTGHWKSFTHSAYHGIDDDGEPIWREVNVYHCNLCNRRTVIKENYCPNCGADMRGDTK